MRARDIIEAEDPKGFFRKQMPLVDINQNSPAKHCGICGDRTAYYVRIEGVKLSICKACHRCGFSAPLQREPRPRQEAEDPKKFLKQHAPPAQFEVDGKYHAWVVDGQGNVLYALDAQRPRRAKVVSIKKFNVEEYRERNGKWPTGQIKLDQISYWDWRGRYFACGGEVYRR